MKPTYLLLALAFLSPGCTGYCELQFAKEEPDPAAATLDAAHVRRLLPTLAAALDEAVGEGRSNIREGDQGWSESYDYVVTQMGGGAGHIRFEAHGFAVSGLCVN